MRFRYFKDDAPNWRARVFGPRIARPNEPLPPELETGFPSEYFVMDDVPSGVPAPALLMNTAVMLGRKAHPADDRQLSLLERIFHKIGTHRQSLTNYRVQVGTNSVQAWPFNATRAYAFLVNASANTIFISWGRAADVINGIPIPGNGGFFEPILGTVSSLNAVSTVANQALVVCEGFYFNGV